MNPLAGLEFWRTVFDVFGKLRFFKIFEKLNCFLKDLEIHLSTNYVPTNKSKKNVQKRHVGHDQTHIKTGIEHKLI